MGRSTLNHQANNLPPHPQLIKARMRIDHGSVRAFEVAAKLPAGSVRDVLRGRAVRDTAQAIADFVGWPLDRLFPGRFVIKSDPASQKRDAQSLSEDSHQT